MSMTFDEYLVKQELIEIAQSIPVRQSRYSELRALYSKRGDEVSCYFCGEPVTDEIFVPPLNIVAAKGSHREMVSMCSCERCYGRAYKNRSMDLVSLIAIVQKAISRGSVRGRVASGNNTAFSVALSKIPEQHLPLVLNKAFKCTYKGIDIEVKEVMVENGSTLVFFE